MITSVGLLTLAGCATMHPITSTPPVPKIVLSAPYDSRAFAGVLPPVPFHVVLPPGEYRPLYEDDQSYYYQAPSKVVVNDLVSSLYDGGIYVQRGTTTPTGWYYSCDDGSIKWGTFSTRLPLK